MASGKVTFQTTKFTRIVDTGEDGEFLDQASFEEAILDDPMRYDLEILAAENLEILSVEDFIADESEEAEEEDEEEEEVEELETEGEGEVKKES